MKAFSFFIAVIIIAALKANAQTPPHYNVLFISIDDMNERCSILDYPEVLTPNLQRLASHGMVFKNAYTQFPLCNPSRTSLMTGWRPDKTTIYDNYTPPRYKIGDTIKFIPEYFHDFNYRTERYGKIMHSLFESQCYWDSAMASTDDPDNREMMLDANAGKANDGATWWIENIPDSATANGLNSGWLINSMKQPKQQPFFYGLGMSTHNSFTPSLFYWNKYGDPSVQELLPINQRGKKTKLKGNGSGNISIPFTPINDRDDVPLIAFPVSSTVDEPDSEWKRSIHAYYGEVSSMDAQLGHVLDEMDRQHLWHNTVVVFWSDHGQNLGEHDGVWLKNVLFRESLHVPFIICAPGKAPGVCNRLVELVDIYPTLIELCGLPPKAGMEGISLVPYLDDPIQPGKKAVFSQVKRNHGIMGYSVRTNRYHYNSWGKEGEELYDIINDPSEFTNLANNAEYTTALNSMRNVLANGWEDALPQRFAKETYVKNKEKNKKAKAAK